MALVNAAHRSLVRLAQRQARKNFAVHVSLSVFTCQTANRTQNDIPSPPTYPSAKTPSVPMKRSRAAPPAAAPSRWPLYRGSPIRLSTRFLKVFRQRRVFYPARDPRGFFAVLPPFRRAGHAAGPSPPATRLQTAAFLSHSHGAARRRRSGPAPRLIPARDEGMLSSI